MRVSEVLQIKERNLRFASTCLPTAQMQMDTHGVTTLESKNALLHPLQVEAGVLILVPPGVKTDT